MQMLLNRLLFLFLHCLMRKTTFFSVFPSLFSSTSFFSPEVLMSRHVTLEAGSQDTPAAPVACASPHRSSGGSAARHGGPSARSSTRRMRSWCCGWIACGRSSRGSTRNCPGSTVEARGGSGERERSGRLGLRAEQLAWRDQCHQRRSDLSDLRIAFSFPKQFTGVYRCGTTPVWGLPM